MDNLFEKMIAAYSPRTHEEERNATYHLQTRIREFNGVDMNRDEFLAALRERLASTDINQVKD